MPKPREMPLSLQNRLVAILLGTAYLVLLSGIYSDATGRSFLVAALCIFSGALAIMGSLGYFCMKFARHQGQRRVRLATLFVLFIPVAVYSAAIHWLSRGIGGIGLSGTGWLFAAPRFVVGIIFTTVVLLMYAEALAWLALKAMGFSRTMRPDALRLALLESINQRRGHFRFESGDHGDRWLELESLCCRPNDIQPFAAALAERLSAHFVEVVCGPLNEGAFVALMVAQQLDVEFCYAQRLAEPGGAPSSPVAYRIPRALHDRLRGKRVAIVDDVINAGSAVAATAAELQAIGAELVAIASLMTLGDGAAELARARHVPQITLASLQANLWPADECPLCRAGVPVDKSA
jgi:orotate phosphoribosyltransferase